MTVDKNIVDELIVNELFTSFWRSWYTYFLFRAGTQTMEWFVEGDFLWTCYLQSRRATYNYKRASKIDFDASELWWNRSL